ncbi:hypothetical protein OPQ81_000380 [Rhizoctonia solani]|nr:hypothetical protein OPQ81_000380 [Rhizoctonia solani]
MIAVGQGAVQRSKFGHRFPILEIWVTLLQATGDRPCIMSSLIELFRKTIPLYIPTDLQPSRTHFLTLLSRRGCFWAFVVEFQHRCSKHNPEQPA